MFSAWRRSRSTRLHKIGFLALALLPFAHQFDQYTQFLGEAAVLRFPPGLACAILFLGGRKFWPLILISVMCSKLILGSTLGWSIATASWVTVEALCVYYIMVFLRTRRPSQLEGLKDYGWFLVAASVASLWSATLGSLTLLQLGLIDQLQVGAIAIRWWVEHFFSLAILMPFILTTISFSWRRFLSFAQTAEVLALLSITALSGQIFFHGWFSDYRPIWLTEPFVAPLLMWAAVRFGRQATLCVILLLHVQAWLGALNHTGYFANDLEATGLMAFWYFFIQRGVIGVVLAIVIHDRDGLRVSERWFRQIANTIPQLTWTCLPSGECDYLSTQWVKYTGIPELPQLGSGWLEQIHADDKERLMKTWNQSVAQKTGMDVNFRIRGANGIYRWFQTTAIPILDARGEVTKWLGSNTDIHELHESRRRYNDLVETTEGIVWEADAQTLQFTFVSSQAERLLGFPVENWFIKDFWANQIHPADREITLKTCSEWMHLKSSYRLEYRMYAKDGRCLWIDDIVSVTYSEGRPILLRGIMIDITDKKLVEEKLEIAKKKAEDATAAKSLFLATMSHEIRTPMNGIVGILSLMSQTSLSDEQKKFVDLGVESTHHLLQVVNDILDFSEIEAGAVRLSAEPFALKEMICKGLAPLAFQAQQKGLHCEILVDDGVPEWVKGDAVRVRQVLINLFSNAMKFTKVGEIVVRISRSEVGDFLKFTVKDSGEGVEESNLEKIFSPFRQVSADRFSSLRGTGLGLAICRDLVRLMGGEIGVDSQLGVGSTFWFSVSLPQVASPIKPFVEPARLSSSERLIKVLMVEDDVVSSIVQRGMLERANCEVVHAASGYEAVSIASQQIFDLVIMDLQLPDIDGLEATRIILKESEERGLKPPPIVALTANALHEYKTACLDAGMKDFFSKPLSPECLRKVIGLSSSFEL